MGAPKCRYLEHLGARNLLDLSLDTAAMEVAFLASGEQLTVLDADEVQGQSAKTVKRSLAAQVGVTRFRQKLFWEDGCEIEDDEVFTSVPVKIQLLVLEFLPPDSEQDKKMMLAAEEDDSVALEKLLKSPRSPNVRDERGFTPLHCAAMGGHSEPLRQLLEAGAELEARNISMFGVSSTPIHLAAAHGHLDAVRLLVESGADYHSTRKDGQIALDLASFCGHEEIVRFLSELPARKENSQAGEA